MNRGEIIDELKMTYEDLQHYLVQKYGCAKFDYFVNPECKTKNKKVSRTSEGLYCHHMDEDKGGSLGNPPQAKKQPFEWQKKERLVYCNILEHLILHMKIAVLRQRKTFDTPTEIADFFSTGGSIIICNEINDMFMNDGTKVAWKKRCFEEIKENYKDYILLVKSFLRYIEMDYRGDKTEPSFLVPGSKVHFADADCEILEISENKDAFLLRMPSGEVKEMRSVAAFHQFTYADQFDLSIRMMSSGYENFYADIYDDVVKPDDNNLIEETSKAFKVDYHGYGFAQYAEITLDDFFGSHSADEYVSKALPMYSKKIIDLEDKFPKFWKGKDIPTEAESLFYIVRLKASFSLKEGMKPCVRYRGCDILRSRDILSLNNNHNLKDNGWTVLATSDLYNKETDTYYSQYRNESGNTIPVTVTVSLGKDDYLLFKERYNIRYIEILDGCFFS